jgi:hypothetical protein
MKSYEIVIASYREKMNWLTYLPEESKRDYTLTVSNSGGVTSFPNVDRVLNVENACREAGHYLNFIIANYDNLHPVTVFLQADPWSHAAGHIEELLALLFDKPTFQYPMSYLGAPYSSFGLPPMKGFPLDQILTKVWGATPYPKSIPFSIGAQFYVTKEVILRKPKEYYEEILKEAKVCEHSFAHLIEACWGNVFVHTV